MKNYNIYNIDLSYINQLIELEKDSFSSPWSVNSFKDSFSNPNYSFLAAISKQNLLLGYIGSYHIIDQLFITNIVVKTSYRQLGIASNLLTNLITTSQNKNISSISLEVRVSNWPAINLYKKFKFKQVGLRKNFYALPSEDAFIFNLYLH